MSAAVSEPNAIFSLRFPVRQGTFRPHYGPEAQLIAEVEICPSLHETARDVERWTALAVPLDVPRCRIWSGLKDRFTRDYSAFRTASPIARVPTRSEPGSQMSPVRNPLF